MRFIIAFIYFLLIFPLNLTFADEFVILKNSKVNVRYGPSFEYPIKRSSNLRDKFIKRMNGNFEISETIVPKFEDTHVCEPHGNNYVPDNLIKVSPNIKFFTETSEFILKSECYGIPAEGWFRGQLSMQSILQELQHSLLWE